LRYGISPIIEQHPNIDQRSNDKSSDYYRINKEKTITKKQQKKLVQIEQYIAEVDVELIDNPEGWSHYLSLEDAQKLIEYCRVGIAHLYLLLSLIKLLHI
jgi:hypothetical protein